MPSRGQNGSSGSRQVTASSIESDAQGQKSSWKLNGVWPSSGKPKASQGEQRRARAQEGGEDAGSTPEVSTEPASLALHLLTALTKVSVLEGGEAGCGRRLEESRW